MLEHGFKRALKRALTGANIEQTKSFIGILPAKFDHFLQMVDHANPSSAAKVRLSQPPEADVYWLWACTAEDGTPFKGTFASTEEDCAARAREMGLPDPSPRRVLVTLNRFTQG